MTFFLSLLFRTAAAVPVIDTQDFEQYKRSHFESHETGWFGLNAEWAQRIYIGESEDDTAEWFSRMQTQYYKQKMEPIEGDWDEGWGNPDFMMVRIQTLGLLCQGTQASLCIEHLRSRIVEINDSICPAPTVKSDGYLWIIQVSDTACSFSFQGGQPVYDRETLQFSELPTTITIYNRYAMSWKYTRQEFTSYAIVRQNKAPLPQKTQQ